MTIREGTQLDTLPVQCYGWDGTEPVKVFVSASGEVAVIDSGKMRVPYHNSQVIDESDPNNVIITYKLDGTTVATKTIATSGTTTTITLS
jgi:hypothetical protein